jgi:hypothetical protein
MPVRRLIAVLLLCVWGAPLGFPHADAHDLACDPAVVQHDPAAHRFAEERPRAAESHHCVLCHWLRSLRGPAEHNTHPVAVFVASFDLHTPVDAVPSGPSRLRLPARAPPA